MLTLIDFSIDAVIPSVDDFDMNDLKNLVEELQHEYD